MVGSAEAEFIAISFPETKVFLFILSKVLLPPVQQLRSSEGKKTNGLREQQCYGWQTQIDGRDWNLNPLQPRRPFCTSSLTKSDPH